MLLDGGRRYIPVVYRFFHSVRADAAGKNLIVQYLHLSKREVETWTTADRRQSELCIKSGKLYGDSSGIFFGVKLRAKH